MGQMPPSTSPISTGNMVWQIAMGANPADANLTSVQNSTRHVVLNKP
jgi:hypothetical protein